MKNEDIKKAFERLSPSGEAKERMLKGIAEKSANAAADKTAGKICSQPIKAKFNSKIGVCTAVLACAAVFAVTVLSPGLLSGGKKEDLVAEQQQSLETCVQENIGTVCITADSAAAVSGTALTSEISGNAAVPDKSIFGIDRQIQEESSLTETAVSVKSGASESSEKSTVITTAAVQDAREPDESTAAAEALCTEETSSEKVTEKAVYKNLYDFSDIIWNGRSYSTDYTEASYGSINSFLGSGAALNYETNKAYTVLIYELKNVSVEDGFAVQYLGQSNYYIFYSVSY